MWAAPCGAVPRRMVPCCFYRMAYHVVCRAGFFCIRGRRSAVAPPPAPTTRAAACGSATTNLRTIGVGRRRPRQGQKPVLIAKGAGRSPGYRGGGIVTLASHLPACRSFPHNYYGFYCWFFNSRITWGSNNRIHRWVNTCQAETVIGDPLSPTAAWP